MLVDATVRFIGAFSRPLLREVRENHRGTLVATRCGHVLENVVAVLNGVALSYKLKSPKPVAANVVQQAYNEAGGHQ